MSYWIMGILTGLCGLAGLLMAGAARDTGILIFGLALAIYATLFCWFMIKKSFDEEEEEAGTRPVLRE
jgi:hypothetical protein